MGRNCTLLRSQRKHVFDVLGEIGLEPVDFSWAEQKELGGDIVVSRLNYREGSYYFQFASYELSSWCVLCPGRYKSMEYERPMNWREQEASFRAWAQCLRREMESPDPWAELARYRIMPGAELAEAVVNEPIPACDAEQIIAGLARVAARAQKELMLDSQGLELVRGRLDHLAEAAKRQRSRDWVYAALGVCITTAVGLSQPPERAGTLWQLMKAEIGPCIPGTPRTVRGPVTLGVSRILGLGSRTIQADEDRRAVGM